VAKPVPDASIDFYGYYITASAIHQGKPIYAQETYDSVAAAIGVEKAALVRYPPTFAMLIQPVLLVSPYVASLIWFSINVGMLLLGVGLLLSQSNVRDHHLRISLLLLPVLFTPVLLTFYHGQVNILIFMLTVLTYLAFVRRRPYISGVLLALSTWIKIWPITLIAYFVWKREWKVVSGAIIGLLLIGVLTLTLAGVGQTTSFFKDVLPVFMNGTERGLDHLNQSVPGVFAKLFAPSSNYVQPFILNPLLAQLGSRTVTLLLIVTTVILCSWPVDLKEREQFSTEFVLVVITSMLITAWLWEASLTLLLPAYFFIAEELQSEQNIGWKQIALPIVTVVLIDVHRVIWTLANPDKQALPGFLLICPFLGLMLIWLTFVQKRLREIKALKKRQGMIALDASRYQNAKS
jgi:hypothetical protein